MSHEHTVDGAALLTQEFWDARYGGADQVWSGNPNPRLVEHGADLTPGTALDVGCGEGADAIWLAERGWRVTAVDFSDVALDRGRRRAEAAGVPGAVEWICADLVDFDPTGATYDLVLVMFVHLRPPERRRLLQLSAATLVPGGLVLVAGYDSTNPEGGGGPRDPEILFTPEGVAADLEGLRIERAERIQVGEAVDTVVRAVKD